MPDTSQNIFEKVVEIKMVTRDIGIIGENAACAFLSKKGYLIENRNFRLDFGEIDIIAMDKDGCRVFVEVKTRKNSKYGYPSEFVNQRKQDKIRNAALVYCGGESYMRFDIIEVYYSILGDRIIIDEINHIEDAF